MNVKMFIIVGIIILIIVVGIAIYFKSNVDNVKNVKYEIEVTAITSGTDEFGNNLKGITQKYKYEIRNSMVFYEIYSNEWTTNKKNTIGKIMTIKKINKEDIVIETINGLTTIEYDKENSISSLMFTSDGLNCVYYYKIISQ